MAETGDGLAGSLLYSADLFDAATASRLAGHFEALLAAVVAAPEARLSSLPLLSAGERQQLLREWSGAAGELAVGETAPEMFARQARRTPLAAAVVCGQERLS